MRLAIRSRLTLASAGLVAAVLVAIGAFVYLRFEADLVQAVDAGLRSRADALLASPGGPDILGSGTFGEPDEAFAQVLGRDGQVLASSPGLADGSVLLADVRGSRIIETIASTVDGEVPARALAVPIDGGRVLVVGASLEDQRESLGRLAALLLVGGPITLALLVGVVWLIVGAALRPVEAMRAEAAMISASEAGRRLPVPPSGDELARLGETLNTMLERLEEVLERERRFVDDASHELRTPLSNLKAELDLALRRSRSVDELERTLRSAAEETDRLVRLAEDLLVLARADRGLLPVLRVPVDVAAMVGGAAEPFEASAAQRQVEVEVVVPDGLRADLDELRMRQAIGNLLGNALRHTPSGGRVTIQGDQRDGVLRLEVRDTGPGFPSEFISSAFEAFARPDASRAPAEGGVGLGLAIVRAVAEAHGGAVEAANLPEGGAAVVLRIPLGSAS